jgi:hypothetical protein
MGLRPRFTGTEWYQCTKVRQQLKERTTSINNRSGVNYMWNNNFKQINIKQQYPMHHNTSQTRQEIRHHKNQGRRNNIR